MDADLLYRRFWVLSLLLGVERAGRAPIDIKTLHSLCYLANALAPCYGVEPLDATVLKEKAGPLYPELVWDADRLVGMGLLSVSNLVLGTGVELRSVSYSLTAKGAEVAASIAKGSEQMETLARSLRSIALAYARNPNSVAEVSLLHRDGNYADPHHGLGDVIDFGEWDRENASFNAVQHIKDTTPTSVTAPAGVNLYVQYLSRTEGSASAKSD